MSDDEIDDVRAIMTPFFASLAASLDYLKISEAERFLLGDSEIVFATPEPSPAIFEEPQEIHYAVSKPNMEAFLKELQKLDFASRKPRLEKLAGVTGVGLGRHPTTEALQILVSVKARPEEAKKLHAELAESDIQVVEFDMEKFHPDRISLENHPSSF